MNRAECAGIDLGTTNSSLGLATGDGVELVRFPPDESPLLPSRVGFTPKGEFRIGPGTRNYEHDSTLVAKEFKRALGTGRTYKLRRGEFNPVELSAFVLRKLRDRAREDLGVEVERAVISVPASFNDAQREATVQAARAAEIKVAQLINEPTAAAVAMWSEAMRSGDRSILHRALDGASNLFKGYSEETLLVFDLGGGTFDVTIVKIRGAEQEVVVSEGDAELGGKDFDRKLAEVICSEHGIEFGNLPGKSKQLLAREAEKCKFTLDEDRHASYYIPGFELRGGKEQDLSGQVARRQFEQRCSGLLRRASETTRQALRAAGLQPKDIHQVALVGGGSLTPCVQEKVSELFERKVSPLENAQTAVVRGAAHYAADLDNSAEAGTGFTTTDVCPRTLGLGIITREKGRLVSRVEPIIEKNTSVPAEVTEEYSMLERDQDNLIIEVYECPRSRRQSGGFERMPENCNLIQKREISDIPRSYGDKHPIEVSFRYDADGRVQVSAEVAGRSENIEFRDRLEDGLDVDSDSVQRRVEQFAGPNGKTSTSAEQEVELSIDHLNRPTLKSLLKKADEQVDTAEGREKLNDIKRRLKRSRDLSERELDEIEDELADLLLGL